MLPKEFSANPRRLSPLWFCDTRDRAGKQQAIGALLGQAKKRNPNANPNEVRRICLELIERMP